MCIAFFLVASVSCESASHGTESTPKRIPELLSLSNQNDTATTPAGAPGPESARTTDAPVPTGRDLRENFPDFSEDMSCEFQKKKKLV